jgi:hypothetical protein
MSTKVCNIDRRSDLSEIEFKQNYYLKKPVLIHAGGLNVHSKWSKQRFLRDFGQRSIQAGTLFALSQSGYSQYSTTVAEYIKQMSSPFNYFNTTELYIFDRNATRAFPELVKEYRFHPFFREHTYATTISLGRSGTGLPFHYHKDGWLEVSLYSIA